VALTPEQRSLRSEIAAHDRWSREDPLPTALRGQAGLTARFEREVRAEFPDLSDAEVARRVEHARRAHFARLALASAKARSQRGSEDAACRVQRLEDHVRAVVDDDALVLTPDDRDRLVELLQVGET
jgi:hypothetical protein